MRTLSLPQLLLQLDLFDTFVQPFTSGQYSTWAVLLEMLLIGLPIYFGLRFLRGTRGERLVWAVGFILVISFLLVRVVAQKFAMDRINFLYPYFVIGVMAVALVVFQPELRRGLIRVGESGWFRTWTKSAQRAIDPVVQAVAMLSKKKIGALIAIERTTSLGGVSGNGVHIDATLTPELLESIFWPGSALHDMGVVIASGRVVAAGCQFPLADAGDVDRALGSRHRAAVGMSQECDAVIVVVSEETGTISVAQRGRLRRSLTPDSLRDLLYAAFETKASPKPQPPTGAARQKQAKEEPKPAEKQPARPKVVNPRKKSA